MPPELIGAMCWPTVKRQIISVFFLLRLFATVLKDLVSKTSLCELKVSSEAESSPKGNRKNRKLIASVLYFICFSTTWATNFVHIEPIQLNPRFDQRIQVWRLKVQRITRFRPMISYICPTIVIRQNMNYIWQ